ncbi:MAG: F0F1 ATP synthase subunit B [Candidatus Margulisiibacteriota bacterium]
MFELETGLIFWNTVSFAILVFLMYKWVLPPIVKVIKEREKAISDSVALAADAQKRSEELLSSYKEKMAEADRSAQKILIQAKDDGDRARAETLERAEKQATLILDQAREDLNSEKAKILNDAKKEIAELVALAAGKVIGRVIKKEDNLKIIEEALR